MKQTYQRDGLGNILYTGCSPLPSIVATEAYGYDELQRLLSASRSWLNLVPSAGTTLADACRYDDLGNIRLKSDYGDGYAYGSAARSIGLAGPHAVTSVTSGGATKATFSYDLDGNLVQGDGRTLAFDHLDRPTTVVMGGVTTKFRYAPDGSRYVQRTIAPTSAKTVYYVDKDYEQVEWGAQVEAKTYIGPSVVVYSSGGSRAVRYQHLDRLGSVEAVTTQAGAEYLPDAHEYDAFGRPRGRDWQPSGDKLHATGDFGSTTERGFTGHEHLDDTYLIHMNGRVYDYRLGRFLSVDPLISNPANSQSINPYSYIGNNPLSGVDPTGYTEQLLAGDCKFQKCDDIGVNTGPVREVQTQGRERTSGATGQGPQATCTSATTCGGPQETASQDKGLLRRAWDWIGVKLGDAVGWIANSPTARLLSRAELDGDPEAHSQRVQQMVERGTERVATVGTELTEKTLNVATAAAAAEGAIAIAGVRTAARVGEAAEVATKAINLPAWRKVGIDMEHILERHAPGAPFEAGRDVFPAHMSEQAIEAAIRQAYRVAERVGGQGDRVLVRGAAQGLTIEMWINKASRTIETAYPVFR